MTLAMYSVLDLSFIGLTVLFTAWNTITLARLWSYRRLAGTAELTWSVSKPWFYNLCIGIGFFMVSLTVLSLVVLNRPLLSTLAQALMAVYYTVLFPLSFRIRRGFYQSGIWFERAFVPYSRINRLSWRDSPEITLFVTTSTPLGEGGARLRVSGERYGEARRILASHVADRSLSIADGMLGLSDVERPAQEQV